MSNLPDYEQEYVTYRAWADGSHEEVLAYHNWLEGRLMHTEQQLAACRQQRDQLAAVLRQVDNGLWKKFMKARGHNIRRFREIRDLIAQALTSIEKPEWREVKDE
jgi:hypothetical protein